MGKIKALILKIVPEYAIIPLILSLICNMLCYYGAKLLCDSRLHFDMANTVDDVIPLIPAFSTIYLGCYIFWVVNYVLACRHTKEKCCRFIVTACTAEIISAVFFTLMPTTIIRPEIVGTDFFSWTMKLIYTADTPTNLFPSIHCMASWLCYRAIEDYDEIPKWYKTFSWVFAVLVFLSTLFTKQHVIIDVFGGMAVAEIAIFVGNTTGLYKVFERVPTPSEMVSRIVKRRDE